MFLSKMFTYTCQEHNIYLINISQMDKQSIALINSKIILEFSASDPYSNTRENCITLKLNRNFVEKLLEMDKNLGRCTGSIFFSKKEAM